MYILALVQREHGQSLLEVLAVMVIMALIAGSILAVYAPVAAWIRLSWQETYAGNWAYAIVESLRAQPGLLDEANTGCSAEELGLAWELGNGEVSDVIEISRLADYPHLYQVSVTVPWDQGATSKNVRLDTLMRKEGD